MCALPILTKKTAPIYAQEPNLFAKKAGNKNEALDENQSQQWGGTGTSAQEAIIMNTSVTTIMKTLCDLGTVFL